MNTELRELSKKILSLVMMRSPFPGTDPDLMLGNLTLFRGLFA
jgi:hypothetical protein